MRSCGSARGYTGSHRFRFVLTRVLFYIEEFALVAAVVKGGVAAKDAAAVGGLLTVLLFLLVLLALLVQPVKVAVKVIVKVVVEVVPARLVRVGGGGEGACVRARKDDVLWRGGGGRIHRRDFLCFRARAGGRPLSREFEIYSLDMRVTRRNSA